MFGPSKHVGQFGTAEQDFRYGEQAYGTIVDEHCRLWSKASNVYYYSNFLCGRNFDHCTQGLEKQMVYNAVLVPVLENVTCDQACAELTQRNNFVGAAGLLMAQQQLLHLFPVNQHVVALDYWYRLPVDRSGNRRYAAVRYLRDPKDGAYLWDFGVHFQSIDIRAGDYLLLVTNVPDV
jgi:hypothetical protein